MGRVRFAVRSLAKSPLLSLVVILSLGLGIGVNAAIFSLLHQVVLSSLPVPHPEQLVLLTAPGDLKNGSSWDNDSGGMEYIFNWRVFRELEKHRESAAVAGFRGFPGTIAFSGQSVVGSAMLVSGQYFRVMGIQPLMGRLIGPEDDVAVAGNAVAVLAYRYWHEALGGGTVLNQAIKVNGQLFTVVGIAPPGFTGTTVGSEPSLFVPMSFQPQLNVGGSVTRLDYYWVYLIARLNPGVSRLQAEAALNIPYHGVVEEMASGIPVKPERRERFVQQKLTLKDGRQGNSDFRDTYRSALQILIAATGLVLLIAMANAANLLLARSAERRKELAIRAALGAGRGELMSQFLTEAVLLAVVGGAAGLGIAAVTLKLLIASWGGEASDSFSSTGMEWPVLLFSLGLSVLTGILFGLYPAIDAARVTVSGAMNEGTAKASASRGAARFRKILVCAQVSISILLLIPTGLFLKSLVNLLHVDLGIRTTNVIGFGISPARNAYKPEQTRAIFERAEKELAAIPGVRSAVGAEVPLVSGSNWSTNFRMEGVAPGDRRLNSKLNAVGPGFFSTAGIPLIAGREFTERDTASAPKVAMVNESFVKTFFDGRNPIGHRLGIGKGDGVDVEIVGVVKDSHYANVRQTPPPLFYWPWRQDPQIRALFFYVRSDLPAKQMIGEIRRVMQSIDRDVPIENLRTMEEQVRFNLRNDELTIRLAAAFAILATALAMLGLYGVMAHGVATRRREIGIRMALGAAPGRIKSMVMNELVWVLGFGLGVGIPAALASTRLIESRLFGVQARDASIVMAAALLLGITAAAAAYWPARRAARVNPVDALRCE
jgi:predicted permease